MNRSQLGHEKALWAVDRARSELQRLGYTVGPPLHVCAKGSDLIFARPGKRALTCEVKLVMHNKRAWRVNRVTRKKDDFIALVFPSGHVVFEKMGDHLRNCNRSGDRYLTALGRFYE